MHDEKCNFTLCISKIDEDAMYKFQLACFLFIYLPNSHRILNWIIKNYKFLIDLRRLLEKIPNFNQHVKFDNNNNSNYEYK